MRSATRLLCMGILGALLSACVATTRSRVVSGEDSTSRISSDEVEDLLWDLFAQVVGDPGFQAVCRSGDGDTTFDVQFDSAYREEDVSFDLVVSIAARLIGPGSRVAKSLSGVNDAWTRTEASTRPLIRIKAEYSLSADGLDASQAHNWMLFVFPSGSNAAVASSRSSMLKSRRSLSR